MTQCIVCDIDGTIAVKKKNDHPRGSWEASIVEDPPKVIVPMRTLVQAAVAGGLYALYATARRDVLREATSEWLASHGFPSGQLYMRASDGASVSQDVLKLRYLKQIREQGWLIVAWFEDDPATIASLRYEGVNAIAC